MEKEQEHRKGYLFGGWYIDEECTKRLNPGGILPTTMTLYDKWIPIWYKINYDLDGGMNSRLNPQFLNIESGVLRLYPAKKSGMVFDHWSLNGQKIHVIPEGQSEEITLKAHYRSRSKVSFESNGGGNIEPKLVDSNGYLKPFRHPLKLGHEFCGWYYDSKFKKPFSFDQVIKESCTLCAKWEVAIYHVRYNANGGISSRKNPHVYTYFNSDIELLPAYKKGYVFDGWFDQRGNPLKKIYAHSIGDKFLIAHFHKEDQEVGTG